MLWNSPILLLSESECFTLIKAFLITGFSSASSDVVCCRFDLMEKNPWWFTTSQKPPAAFPSLFLLSRDFGSSSHFSTLYSPSTGDNTLTYLLLQSIPFLLEEEFKLVLISLSFEHCLCWFSHFSFSRFSLPAYLLLLLLLWQMLPFISLSISSHCWHFPLLLVLKWSVEALQGQ